MCCLHTAHFSFVVSLLCRMTPACFTEAIACRTDKLETLGEALPVLEFAAAETRKRAPHLTHPHLCLEAIRFGVEHGGLAGLRKVQTHQSCPAFYPTSLTRFGFAGHCGIVKQSPPCALLRAL